MAGIKNLEIFNKAFMGKWLWRLLSGEVCLWRDVLMTKYNISNVKSLMRGGFGKNGSQWWCGLMSCCDEMFGNDLGWFQVNIVKEVAVGTTVFSTTIPTCHWE